MKSMVVRAQALSLTGVISSIRRDGLLQTHWVPVGRPGPVLDALFAGIGVDIEPLQPANLAALAHAPLT
jgi:hypothetical protein